MAINKSINVLYNLCRISLLHIMYVCEYRYVSGHNENILVISEIFLWLPDMSNNMIQFILHVQKLVFKLINHYIEMYAY